MAANPLTPHEEQIERKREDFWAWLKKWQHAEDGHSIDLDKFIPGFASVIAIVVFAVKEYVDSKKDQVFTEYAFTIGLQSFNIAIILIILSRSLKIARDIKIDVPGINKNYIFSLERQFVKHIKLFYAMTMFLYVGLIFSTVLSKNAGPDATRGVYGNVLSGRKKVLDGIHKIGHLEQDTTNKFSETFLAQLTKTDSSVRLIRENLEQIFYNDSVLQPQKGAPLNELQKINAASEDISNNIVALQETFLPNKSDSIRSKLDTAVTLALNSMYYGAQEIRMNTEQFSKENIGILIGHTFTLLASNLGALFLLFSFYVLHNKTIDKDGKGEYNKSLLTLSHFFAANINEDKQDPRRICRLLIIGLFIVTISHVLFEYQNLNSSEDVNTLFTMLSGLFTALALSLLVARFESSLLNPTFNVLVILYIYAVIQVLFGVFNMPLFKHPHLIEDFTILIAFIGKCFLYLYILWLLRTDRLKYYFYHKSHGGTATKKKLEWDEFLKKVTPVDKVDPDSNSPSLPGLLTSIDPSL